MPVAGGGPSQDLEASAPRRRVSCVSAKIGTKGSKARKELFVWKKSRCMLSNKIQLRMSDPISFTCMFITFAQAEVYI